MKKPNFFLIGAPKCGTTALASWLGAHPQVFFSRRKEPHFFNTDGLTATGSLAEYEALFSGAEARHRAVGEGSTHYLYSREAVGQILDYAPRARFMVCVRNPIEMAPSLHNERIKQGRETEPSFERAWRLQTERASGRHVPRTVRANPGRLLYGPCCRLGEQLERAIARAGRERVLVVVLDDLRRDARVQYRRVLEFLELDDDGRVTFPVVNAARTTRSIAVSVLARHAAALKRRLRVRRRLGLAGLVGALNSSPGGPTRLEASFRAELADYFADDIRRLESLLGRDLSSWLSEPSTRS